ncbi:MAG: DUF3341 domain-containing protein [Planctomycetota bacterium]
MKPRLHIGVFEDASSLLAAARECRERSIPLLDAYSPHPIHGIDELVGIPRSRLPRATFFGGVLGASLALWFEFWVSAQDWPLNVGGKPFDSLPAFVPVGFEMLILFAGLATALGFFLRSRLAPGRQCSPWFERVTDDRYVLVAMEKDAGLPAGEMASLWRRHGAVEFHEELPER